MPYREPSWRFDRPEQLAEALIEQGAEPDELGELIPVVRRLSEWQAPAASPGDARHLLTFLVRALPALSPVRQAIRAYQERQGAGVRRLLAIARTQVNLFGPAFWLVSALITIVGAGAVLSIGTARPGENLVDQTLLLRASGPLLAYLGTLIAFRGLQQRVLEFELVCLASPLQLALARLVIVLGYDLGLGLALSLALWVGGTSQVLSLMLSWFMPLLLVSGLALMLSLHLSSQAAASIAYGIWLSILTISTTTSLHLVTFTPLCDVLIGGIGLALLGLALLRLRPSLHRLLPIS